MLFDRPASLPIATVRSSSHLVTFKNQLRGTRDRSWRWMRPRLVPLMVAIVGMLAVLGSAEYLTHLARHTPNTPIATIEPVIAARPIAARPIAARPIDQSAISVDGKPSALGSVMQLPGRAPVRVVVLSAP